MQNIKQFFINLNYRNIKENLLYIFNIICVYEFVRFMRLFFII